MTQPKHNGILAITPCPASVETLEPRRLLSTVITSGSNVDGWLIGFPASVHMIEVNETPDTLTLKMRETFHDTGAINISFNQVSKHAAARISISGDTVRNQSGGDFDHYELDMFINIPHALPSFARAFDSFSPFSNVVVSAQKIALGNGTLADGGTAAWGGKGHGHIVILPHPTAASVGNTFYLFQGPGPIIPPPAGAASHISASPLAAGSLDDLLD